MRIRFIYFAGCREAIGRIRDETDLAAGATVRDATAWIAETYPAVAGILSTARVAVNQEFARLDDALADGDELVLIPPISGGSDARAALNHEPIEREAALALVRPDGAGALITFAGVVRPTSKAGRSVTDLFYEAYEPMAVAKLEECVREARERWPILDAAVVHRLGQLQLGEVAVSIVVVAAHRREGFEACAHIIDRIKEIVPIWKKETGPAGEAWVSEGA